MKTPTSGTIILEYLPSNLVRPDPEPPDPGHGPGQEPPVIMWLQ